MTRTSGTRTNPSVSRTSSFGAGGACWKVGAPGFRCSFRCSSAEPSSEKRLGRSIGSFLLARIGGCRQHRRCGAGIRRPGAAQRHPGRKGFHGGSEAIPNDRTHTHAHADKPREPAPTPIAKSSRGTVGMRRRNPREFRTEETGIVRDLQSTSWIVFHVRCCRPINHHVLASQTNPIAFKRSMRSLSLHDWRCAFTQFASWRSSSKLRGTRVLPCFFLYATRRSYI